MVPRRPILLLAVGLVACDCGGGSGDDMTPAAPLVFEPALVDFGRVSLGLSARVRLDVLNPGNGLVRIERAAPADALRDEVRLSGVPASLLKQTMASIDVIFTPTSVGTRMGDLIFDVEGRSITVPVIGTVVDPDLTVMPSMVDFGRVVIGEVASATITITNDGLGPAKISALTLDPGSSSAFVAQLDVSQSLDPGESFDFLIQYVPGDRGTDIGRVVIADDTPRPVRIGVDVIGEGIASEIQIEPDLLNFFGTLVGETRTVELELRNIGSQDHQITALTIEGDAADMFFVDTSTLAPPFTIPQGAILRVPIGFRPDQTGFIEAQLFVFSTGLVEPAPVDLVGRAESAPRPNVIVRPTPIDFGIVAVGHITPRRVRIENPGATMYVVKGVPTFDPPSAPFEIIGWPGPGTTLGGAESHTFTIQATPQTVGVTTAELLFRTGLDDVPERRVPVRMDAQPGPIPDLLFETSSVDFGLVERGSVPERRIDVRSVGDTACRIERVSIEGDERFFVIGPVDQSQTLQPGVRHAIRIGFDDPLGPVDTSTAVLVVTSNDASEPRYEIPLRASTAAVRTDPPALEILLTWSPPDADLDLHFARDNGVLFDDPNDCCFCNPAPIWSFAGRTLSDPIHLADSVDGDVGEVIYLPIARDQLYRVYVHDARTIGTPVEARITIWSSGQPAVGVLRTVTPRRAWDVGLITILPQSGAFSFAASELPLTDERRDRCF